MRTTNEHQQHHNQSRQHSFEHRNAERVVWADKIEYSALYVQPPWTFSKWIEAAGLALETWLDRMATKLGILDAMLDRVTTGTA